VIGRDIRFEPPNHVTVIGRDIRFEIFVRVGNLSSLSKGREIVPIWKVNPGEADSTVLITRLWYICTRLKTQRFANCVGPSR